MLMHIIATKEMGFFSNYVLLGLYFSMRQTGCNAGTLQQVPLAFPV